MDALKEEFKRLIDMMGWSQTEAAKRLAKTPSAINHLVNPDHSNTPTQSTLRFLKLIISRERPDLFNTRTLELKELAKGVTEYSPLNAKELDLIQRLRSAPHEEQEKIYAVIATMLGNTPKAKTPKSRKHS
jgi:transcriptional regulator with XRE-family HTH domain